MFKAALMMLLLVTSSVVSAEEKVIRVNVNNDPNADYALSMLSLALAKIETKYRIHIMREEFTQARVNEEVRTGGALDLLWTTADIETEKALLPIRIPLFKGLLGYRIFIIRKGDQYKFDDITTLDELKRITVGQGRVWSDTRILEANGFKVVKTNKYPGLFYMVDGGRFDAFPRGVHEPFAELEQRPQLNLVVEKNLMVAYKMPFYFFVSYGNPDLARDIETGLNRAIADGSFDQTFINAPSVQDIIKKANIKQRRVFHLENPTLTKETPLDRKELWFDPQDLP